MTELLPYLYHVLGGLFCLAAFGITLWAYTDKKSIGWLLLTIHGGFGVLGAVLGALQMRQMIGHHDLRSIGIWSAVSGILYFTNTVVYLVALVLLARATPSQSAR